VSAVASATSRSAYPPTWCTGRANACCVTWSMHTLHLVHRHGIARQKMSCRPRHICCCANVRNTPQPVPSSSVLSSIARCSQPVCARPPPGRQERLLLASQPVQGQYVAHEHEHCACRPAVCPDLQCAQPGAPHARQLLEHAAESVNRSACAGAFSVRASGTCASVIRRKNNTGNSM
jgi:hypothetical protein